MYKGRLPIHQKKKLSSKNVLSIHEESWTLFYLTASIKDLIQMKFHYSYFDHCSKKLFGLFLSTYFKNIWKTRSWNISLKTLHSKISCWLHPAIPSPHEKRNFFASDSLTHLSSKEKWCVKEMTFQTILPTIKSLFIGWATIL